MAKWIIIGLLLVIGAMWFFWPSNKPDYSSHENRIKLREQAISELQVENTKLLSRIKSDSVSHKIEIQAYKDRDKKKSAYIANLKANPVVIKVREEVPLIDSAFQAYDSLLESKDQQINLQEKYVSTLQLDIGALKNSFEERIALQDSTINDQREIIIDLTTRLNKKKPVWQKLGQIGKDILKVGAGVVIGRISK